MAVLPQRGPRGGGVTVPGGVQEPFKCCTEGCGLVKKYCCVYSLQNPSRTSYQKMDERMPSRGRIQLNKIPRYREELENINITAIWRRVGIAQASCKYKQQTLSFSLSNEIRIYWKKRP